MIVLAFLGAGVGLGAWILLRAVSPRPDSLSALQSALGRPGAAAVDAPPMRDDTRAQLGSVASRLVSQVASRDEGQDQLLELTGRTQDQHSLDKLVGAVGGLLGTALLGVALTVIGIAPPPLVLIVAGGAVAAGGFVLPDFNLRDQAERRRRAFRHALSSYLDLVNVILAGGGGIETSLHAAADAGDGWAFASIRQALDRARLTNRSPWDTLKDLGEQLGIDELRELAASVELAGSQGARIRSSLAAKADSLRGHQIAETEAAAEAATERMTIPVAVLLFGFLTFIAYPAVQQITSVSNPIP